jgi:Secretion system C-terminal sorting domain
MQKKIILLSLIVLSVLSKARGQSQANCSNLYLDTTTFYISPLQDTIVSGNLLYNDTTFTVYPVLQLILSDTSIVTSPDIKVLSSLDSGAVNAFEFRIKFKTSVFPNNTTISGLFHIYDSDWPGDSIVTCYYPIKIILQNPTGINEIGNSETLRIYPNPTDKNAILEFDNSKNENCTLTIYDTHGRLVQTITNITTGKVEIERKQLPTGLYFLQLQTNGQIIANGKLSIE